MLSSQLHHCWTEKFIDRIQTEFNANDPKDSELCQNKMKPFEKEVEVWSHCDVQIHDLILVKGRKTYRTVVVAGFSRSFSQDSKSKQIVWSGKAND